MLKATVQIKPSQGVAVSVASRAILPASGCNMCNTVLHSMSNPRVTSAMSPSLLFNISSTLQIQIREIVSEASGSADNVGQRRYSLPTGEVTHTVTPPKASPAIKDESNIISSMLDSNSYDIFTQASLQDHWVGKGIEGTVDCSGAVGGTTAVRAAKQAITKRRLNIAHRMDAEEEFWMTERLAVPSSSTEGSDTPNRLTYKQLHYSDELNYALLELRLRAPLSNDNSITTTLQDFWWTLMAGGDYAAVEPIIHQPSSLSPDTITITKVEDVKQRFIRSLIVMKKNRMMKEGVDMSWESLPLLTIPIILKPMTPHEVSLLTAYMCQERDFDYHNDMTIPPSINSLEKFTSSHQCIPAVRDMRYEWAQGSDSAHTTTSDDYTNLNTSSAASTLRNINSHEEVMGRSTQQPLLGFVFVLHVENISGESVSNTLCGWLGIPRSSLIIGHDSIPKHSVTTTIGMILPSSMDPSSSLGVRVRREQLLQINLLSFPGYVVKVGNITELNFGESEENRYSEKVLRNSVNVMKGDINGQSHTSSSKRIFLRRLQNLPSSPIPMTILERVSVEVSGDENSARDPSIMSRVPSSKPQKGDVLSMTKKDDIHSASHLRMFHVVPPMSHDSVYTNSADSSCNPLGDRGADERGSQSMPSATPPTSIFHDPFSIIATRKVVMLRQIEGGTKDDIVRSLTRLQTIGAINYFQGDQVAVIKQIFSTTASKAYQEEYRRRSDLIKSEERNDVESHQETQRARETRVNGGSRMSNSPHISSFSRPITSKDIFLQLIAGTKPPPLVQNFLKYPSRHTADDVLKDKSTALPVLNGLKNFCIFKGDYDKCLLATSRGLRKQIVTKGPKLLFNILVSARLRLSQNKVMIGDFVVASRNKNKNSKIQKEEKVVNVSEENMYGNTDEEHDDVRQTSNAGGDVICILSHHQAQRYSITDVVIPVRSAGTRAFCSSKQFMDSFSPDEDVMRDIASKRTVPNDNNNNHTGISNINTKAFVAKALVNHGLPLMFAVDDLPQTLQTFLYLDANVNKDVTPVVYRRIIAKPSDMAFDVMEDGAPQKVTDMKDDMMIPRAVLPPIELKRKHDGGMACDNWEEKRDLYIDNKDEGRMEAGNENSIFGLSLDEGVADNTIHLSSLSHLQPTSTSTSWPLPWDAAAYTLLQHPYLRYLHFVGTKFPESLRQMRSSLSIESLQRYGLSFLLDDRTGTVVGGEVSNGNTSAVLLPGADAGTREALALDTLGSPVIRSTPLASTNDGVRYCKSTDTMEEGLFESDNDDNSHGNFHNSNPGEEQVYKKEEAYLVPGQSKHLQRGTFSEMVPLASPKAIDRVTKSYTVQITFTEASKSAQSNDRGSYQLLREYFIRDYSYFKKEHTKLQHLLQKNYFLISGKVFPEQKAIQMIALMSYRGDESLSSYYCYTVPKSFIYLRRLYMEALVSIARENFLTMGIVYHEERDNTKQHEDYLLSSISQKKPIVKVTFQTKGMKEAVHTVLSYLRTTSISPYLGAEQELVTLHQAEEAVEFLENAILTYYNISPSNSSQSTLMEKHAHGDDQLSLYGGDKVAWGGVGAEVTSADLVYFRKNQLQASLESNGSVVNEDALQNTIPLERWGVEDARAAISRVPAPYKGHGQMCTICFMTDHNTSKLCVKFLRGLETSRTAKKAQLARRHDKHFSKQQFIQSSVGISTSPIESIEKNRLVSHVDSTNARDINNEIDFCSSSVTDGLLFSTNCPSPFPLVEWHVSLYRRTTKDPWGLLITNGVLRLLTTTTDTEYEGGEQEKSDSKSGVTVTVRGLPIRRLDDHLCYSDEGVVTAPDHQSFEKLGRLYSEQGPSEKHYSVVLVGDKEGEVAPISLGGSGGDGYDLLKRELMVQVNEILMASDTYDNLENATRRSKSEIHKYLFSGAGTTETARDLFCCGINGRLVSRSSDVALLLQGKSRQGSLPRTLPILPGWTAQYEKMVASGLFLHLIIRPRQYIHRSAAVQCKSWKQQDNGAHLSSQLHTVYTDNNWIFEALMWDKVNHRLQPYDDKNRNTELGKTETPPARNDKDRYLALRSAMGMTNRWGAEGPGDKYNAAMNTNTSGGKDSDVATIHLSRATGGVNWGINLLGLRVLPFTPPKTMRRRVTSATTSTDEGIVIPAVTFKVVTSSGKSNTSSHLEPVSIELLLAINSRQARQRDDVQSAALHTGTTTLFEPLTPKDTWMTSQVIILKGLNHFQINHQRDVAAFMQLHSSSGQETNTSLKSLLLRLSLTVQTIMLPAFDLVIDMSSPVSGVSKGEKMIGLIISNSASKLVKPAGRGSYFDMALRKHAPVWCNLRSDYIPRGGMAATAVRHGKGTHKNMNVTMERTSEYLKAREFEDDDIIDSCVDERPQHQYTLINSPEAESYLRDKIFFDPPERDSNEGEAALSTFDSVRYRLEAVNETEEFDREDLRDLISEIKKDGGIVRLRLRMVLPVVMPSSPTGLQSTSTK